MKSSIDDFMALLSIFLTPILLIASTVVIYLLLNSFIKAVKVKERTAVEWMIIGIVINFAGGIFDNLYWGFAWSYHYIDPSGPEKKFLFDYGVYSNTLFRQIFGIAGALCHIYAASQQSKTWQKTILYTGSILGLLQVIYLILAATY